MEYISLDLSGRKVRDNFNLMLSAICPRPVLLVCTLGADGVRNLAPYSHVTIGGASPPSIVMCSTVERDGRIKDTARNILDTGEYTVNLVTRDFMGMVNDCSRSYPPDVDELEENEFTALESAKVKPPRIAESPVHLECKLHTTAQHGEGPLSSLYIIGEIVMAHVAESIITIDGMVDPQKIQFVSRLGMDWYSEMPAASLFEVPRAE